MRYLLFTYLFILTLVNAFCFPSKCCAIDVVRTDPPKEGLKFSDAVGKEIEKYQGKLEEISESQFATQIGNGTKGFMDTVGEYMNKTMKTMSKVMTYANDPKGALMSEIAGRDKNAAKIIEFTQKINKEKKTLERIIAERDEALSNLKNKFENDKLLLEEKKKQAEENQEIISEISEEETINSKDIENTESSTSSDIVDAPILTPSRRKIGSRETRDVVTGGSGEGSTGSISTGGSSSGGSVLPSRSSGFSGGISQGISSGISGGNSGISSAIAQDKAEDSTSSTSAKEKLSQTVDSSSSAKRNVSGNKEIASQDNTAKADTDTPSIDTRVEQATVGSSSNETSKEKIKVSTRNERSRASSNGSSEDQVNSGVSGVVGKSAGITIGSGNTSSTSNSSEEGQVYSNTSSQVFSLKTEGASRGTQSSKTSHVITVNGEKINILLDEEGNVYYDKIVSADIIKAARDYTSTIKGKLKAREDQKIKYKDVFVEKAKELTVITDIEGKIKADIEEEKMNNLQKQFFLNCQEAAKKEDERAQKDKMLRREFIKSSYEDNIITKEKTDVEYL